MNLQAQRICAWTGVAFLILFCSGWIIAGFVPPPDPSDSPEQIAEMFREDTTRIRLGMCICIFASALLLPWGGAVVVQMRRVEGHSAPLTYAWIIGQACLTIEFVYPCAFWAVAAFRPDDDPEHVQRFNDLAWLPFLGITSTAVFLAFALAALALTDKRTRPVFPRWLGYFLIWDAILFAPAGLIMFFKDGPLAWNGVFAWWVAIAAALAFFVVITAVVLRAIDQQAAEPDDDPVGDLAARVVMLEQRLARLEV